MKTVNVEHCLEDWMFDLSSEADNDFRTGNFDPPFSEDLEVLPKKSEKYGCF